MSSRACDVAVLGGGPAGATAALRLSALGLDATIIEASRYDRPRVGETLAPAARPLLRRLGLEEAVAGLQPVVSHGNVSAWGSEEVRARSFVFQPHGHGWHLDRSRFDEELCRGAARAGATVLAGEQITGVLQAPNGSWHLRLRGDDEISSRAVINAAGRSGGFARALRAGRRVHDHLVGVVVRYPGPVRDDGYTLVEAEPHGWWYSAPLPSGGLIVMHMTDADLCRRAGLSDARAWARRLDGIPHTAARVGDLSPASRPRVFSSISHRLHRDQYDAPWVAAGDHAMAVDPLSSSGILRAIVSGEAAANAIAHWMLGRPEAAVDYEEWLDREFDEYLRERVAVYGLEDRWPSAPFWRRRRARPA